MLPWLPSIPYPPSQDGYWSPVTSTLNWCEEDYYATQYSAEIVNSLTNLIFLYLAIKGIKSCLQNGHDTVFLISFAGYLVVGTGSFLFHSTLKYPMQLVDELSMIYTTCIMCYATFSYAKSRYFSILLAIGLVALAAFITAYYHYLQDPVFHQNAYAILTATVLIRCMFVMELNLRPSIKKKEKEYELHATSPMNVEEKAASAARDRRDLDILHTMWWMIAYGISIFLGGFAIWNMDNVYCSTLRMWRRNIGLPWGILLEGHGWWHLMTGIGAYYYIVWGIWLRHCLNGRQEEYDLVWPSIWCFPDVARRPTMNGVDRKHK
ncbi:hypothetical protein MMC11_004349 [Xylographa trunciseda]|nr:hypothetical protein [Xylographa trunciseda]